MSKIIKKLFNGQLEPVEYLEKHNLKLRLLDAQIHQRTTDIKKELSDIQKKAFDDYNELITEYNIVITEQARLDIH